MPTKKTNSEFLQEWNFSKNGDLKPEDFGPRSSKKVWWKCLCGHEWETRIVHRVNGSGCPACAGRVATSKKNLSVLRPDLLKFWNFEKNQILPIDILPSSNVEIWWRCDSGHEWRQKVCQRTKRKNCPYCSRKRVTHLNNLLVEMPNIAKEWNYPKNSSLKPEDFLSGSGKKVWWICKDRHEWFAAIGDRKKYGCPYCSGNKAGYGNDVATKVPHLKKEWDILKNEKKISQFTTGSDFNAWWKCKRGHSWKATIANRVNGTGCPKCKVQKSSREIRIYTELDALFGAESGIKIGGREADIVIENLKLIVEYDGVFWHKNKIENDKNKNKIFVDNGYYVIRVRETGLEKTQPEDLIIDPRCGDFELVKTIVEAIATKYSKTKQVANKYIENKKLIADKGFLKLLYSFTSNNNNPIKDKKLIAEWNHEKNMEQRPQDFSKFSQVKVWWKCSKGHEYQMAIGARSSGYNCPFCANMRIGYGNDLQSKAPHLAAEWHPTKNNVMPNQITLKNNTKFWWKCANGHEWQTTPYNRASGNNCPYCYGRYATEENNLFTKFPILAAEWHPFKNGELKPTDVKAGSNRKAWWICNKSHEWESVIASRTRGNGCPICAGRKPKK